MSPSEADLRAALREGEGDRVDPYDIIFAARERRARRRTVLLSAAAAVVFVGAAAAGGAALINGSNGSGSNANAGAALAGGGAGASSGAPAVTHHNAGKGGAGTIARANQPFTPVCVTPQVRRSLMNNGSAPAGQLLSGRVKSFVVCAYSTNRGYQTQAPQPVVVTGAAARSVVASLANTSTTPVPANCPIISSTGHLTLTMIPMTSNGQRLPALVATITTPACRTTVRNGSTVRYGWQLPPRIASLLHVSRVSPRHSGGPEMPIDLIPSHRIHASGSPAH